MKWVQTNAICLFAFGWFTASMPSEGQTAKGSYQPPEITLNGLTSIFEDKRALFKIQSPDGFGAQQCYFLAEGQRAGGIELLSVDMKAGKIKVNNHGVIQTIALCQSPDPSTLVAAGGNGRNNPANGQNFEMNSSGGPPLAGTETAGTAGVYSGAEYVGGRRPNRPPAAAPSIDGGANGLPDAISVSDAGSQDPSVANTTTQKPEPYSLAAARQFEQMRIQTANAVYDGASEPVPLTPLTPPGTPLALIGPDRAWFPD